MWVTTAKITINVSGAQAHFSTTQQIFSSSSDPKKQTCISNLFIYFFFQKQIFRGRSTRWLLQKWKNSFYNATEVHYEPCFDSTFLISEFSHGTQLRSLLVHQNTRRVVYADMALESSCCATAQLLLSNVRNPLPSWLFPPQNIHKICIFR